MAAIGVRSVCLNATFETIGCCQALDVPKMTLCGSPADRLAVDVAFGSASAGLVDDDDRLVGQLVLGDDVLHRAGEVVGAAAGTGGCDELDRLGGLPGERRRGNDCSNGERDGKLQGTPTKLPPDGVDSSLQRSVHRAESFI